MCALCACLQVGCLAPKVKMLQGMSEDLAKFYIGSIVLALEYLVSVGGADICSTQAHWQRSSQSPCRVNMSWACRNELSHHSLHRFLTSLLCVVPCFCFGRALTPALLNVELPHSGCSTPTVLFIVTSSQRTFSLTARATPSEWMFSVVHAASLASKPTPASLHFIGLKLIKKTQQSAE